MEESATAWSGKIMLLRREPEGARLCHKKLICTHKKEHRETTAGGETQIISCIPHYFQAYQRLISMNTEKYRSTMAGKGIQIIDSKKQTPSSQVCPRKPTRMSQQEPLSGAPFGREGAVRRESVVLMPKDTWDASQEQFRIPQDWDG